MSYPFVQGISFGPLKGPVKAFAIHMAEGGGTVGYLRDDSTPPARSVSVHYVIEYTGQIVQMLREGDASGSINPNDLRTTDDAAVFGATVRKQVMGSWDHDPNSAVLSCEIEGYASAGPNAFQKAALGRLVDDIRSRHPAMGLLGHRDYQDYKPCPGKLIPWSSLGGHGPYQPQEVDVPTQSYTWPTPTPPPNGTVVMVGTGHYYQTPDLVMHAIDTAAFNTTPPRAATGPVTLTIPLNAAGDVKAYIIGPKVAYVSAKDVTFTPTDVTAAVNAALDHVAVPVAALVTAIGEARP